MQNITQSEFDREVEALKSHRRISVNRPLVDPDLPEIAAAHGSGRELYLSDDGLLNSSSPTNHSSPPRPWNLPSGVSLSDDGPSANNILANNGPSASRSTFSARRRGPEQASSTGEHEEPSDRSSESNRNSSGRVNDDDAASNRPLDPTHLFWVPASMHPEISPSDFRKFLHDHASRAVREQQELQNDALTSVAAQAPKASESAVAHPVEALKKRSTSIARRGSTLRRQYKPETDDDSPATSSVSSPSNMGSRRAVRKSSQSGQERAGVPHLSIDDLQKLERLAEEASKSSDPSELRSVLRRTMSLNVSPSALDQVDAVPLDNEQDAPLIVPRPGQILRRAARTKIRKSSFSTDGSGSGGTTPSGSRRRRGQTGSFASSGGFASVSGEGFESESGSINESGSEGPAHLRQTRLSESNVDNFSRQSFASDDTQRTSITSTESLTSASSSREALNESDALITPTQQSISGRTLGTTGGYFDIHKGNESDDDSALVTSPTAHHPSPDSAAGKEGPRDDTQAVGTARDVVGDDLSTSHTGSTIKPIAVQRVSPVPAFEKTRPAPQPPVGSDEAPVPLAPEPARQREAQSVPAKVPSPSDVFLSTHQVARSDTMPNLAGPSLPSKPAKEKKGAFGLQWLSNWTKDDDSAEKLRKKEKKERKERERERDRESSEQGYAGVGGYNPTSQGVDKEREKDSSSFLGSLFGKRKGNDETARQDYGSHLYGAATGMSNITAGSLLDMHGKGGVGLAYYNRYPIHIERAVYRLSHIKLANPRRPLYEQVLISNLMFWYLSVINQSQQQQQQQQQQRQQQQQQEQQQQLQAQQRQGQPQQNPQQLQLSPQQSLPEQHPQTLQDFGQQKIDAVEKGSGGVPGEMHPALPLAVRQASEGIVQPEGRDSDLDSPASSAVSAGMKGQLSDAGASTSPSTGTLSSIADPAIEQVDYDNDRYHVHPATAVEQGIGGSEVASRSEGQEKVNGYPITTPVSVTSHSSAQQPHWQQPQPAQPGQTYPVSSPTGRSPVLNPQKTRRSGLVKPNRAPPGTRSAEMAIPAAGYGAQHRQLNSEMAHSGQTHTSAYSGDFGSSNAERSNRLSPNLGPNRLTGRSVSPSNSISATEHTWIGSNQRRSPGAEERKSDPIPSEASSRTGGARSGGGGGSSGASGYQRASDPTAGGSMSNGHGAIDDEHRSSAPLSSMENSSAHLASLIDDQIVESKGWSRVPMRDGAPNENGAEAARTEAPLPSLHSPEGGVIPLQAEANAMLGAARKSQSRRR